MIRQRTMVEDTLCFWLPDVYPCHSCARAHTHTHTPLLYTLSDFPLSVLAPRFPEISLEGTLLSPRGHISPLDILIPNAFQRSVIA